MTTYPLNAWETDKTCLYFWANARNHALGGQRLTHELAPSRSRVIRLSSVA